MESIKTERIELDLPQDIIFAMRGTEKQDDIRKKLKTALAILLFQEKLISLGKASELSEMNRVKFMEVLKEHGISAYNYGDKEFEKDQQAVETFNNANKK